MSTLKEIDENINLIFSGFPRLVSSLNFEEVCELNLPFPGARLDQYLQLDAKGIYFFEINTNESGFDDFSSWSKDFVSKWKQPRFEKKFVSNPKDKRLRAHSKLEKWIPLYVGKSEKIKQRLIEHLELGIDSRTYAMKLNLRNEFFDARLRISFLKLEVENYDVIAPRLENAMRERFNPIVGK